jgi:DNA gyrase subunit A
MKLAEGEGILDVQVCSEKDDVLLTTAQGQCIRFAVTDVRVFQGRTSMGVRGINLAEGDRVISQSIVRHLDVSAEERVAYLKRASAVRRGQGGDEPEETAVDAEETVASTIELGEQRYVEMSAAEQFILTLSQHGYGKRSSSYEYRITNRGGKGIVAMAIWEGKKGAETIKEKIGPLVASFPVEESDQIMLVTDGGKLIRTSVNGIRIAGRSTQGVIVFNTADDEKVVSVERIGEEGGEDNGGN